MGCKLVLSASMGLLAGCSAATDDAQAICTKTEFFSAADIEAKTVCRLLAAEYIDNGADIGAERCLKYVNGYFDKPLGPIEKGLVCGYIGRAYKEHTQKK